MDRRSRFGAKLVVTVVTLAVTGSVAGAVVGQSTAQAADSCPNAAIREQQGSGYLPDCRSYEMVSPAAKFGQEIRSTFGTTRVADDGSAVTFTAFGSLPGADVKGAAWVSRYLAHRTDDGWSARSIDSAQHAQILSLGSFGREYQNVQDPASFTADLSASIEQNYEVTLDPDHPTEPGVVDFYRRTYASDVFQKLSVSSNGPEFPALLVGGLPEFVAASADLQHIVFEDNQPLTPGLSLVPGQTKLYEWDHGALRLVGVLPEDEGGGSSPSGSVGAPGRATAQIPTANGRGSRPNVISRDGSRIFFLEGNDVYAGRLMMREHGGQPEARTVWISASEKTTPEATQPVAFWGASPDGSKVLFTTPEGLVDGDDDGSTDLYEYDAQASAGHHLTRLSSGSEPADVRGVLGTSSELARTYFAATGALTGDAPADGEPKVYLVDGGGLRYVAEIASGRGDERNWNTDGLAGLGTKISRVSADGRYLLFSTTAQVGGYDNASKREFHLFDADAPAASALRCPSCRRDGRPPLGDANMGHQDPATYPVQYQPRAMIERGDSVVIYFDSDDALVPRDQNGHRDAYAYDSATSSIALLSSGQDPYDSFFVDATPSGSDVFIATRSQLSGWDGDPLYDIYDAAVDGDVAEPAPAPSCEGDACQGTPTPALAPPSIGSVSFGGAGNALSTPGRVRAAVGVSKVQAVTGSVASLKVRVTAAGRISVAGASIRRSSRSASKAGTYTVKIALSARAKRSLQRRTTLKVGVRVSYRSEDGRSAAKIVAVTFKQPKAARAKAMRANAMKGGR